MVFSSLVFIFLFFAITMFIYSYVSTIRQKNIVLLISSLVFYAWGGPQYLILLFVMSYISWFIPIQIRRHRKRPAIAKLLLVAGCVLDLGFLVYFKYAGFILSNLKSVTGFPEVIPQIALPIGISFYTFKFISYMVDVYRGEVAPQKKFWKILLYGSIFHQCMAGPIVRYADMADEIDHRRTRIPEIGRGINRFAIGLVKKAIFANSCVQISDMFLAGTAAELSGVPAAGLWLGALMYMLQIYLDFSAYSDMAIGLGLMVGFHYKENFDYPYIAGSVTEFWRRWHISLSSFFRDYVYIPLGGNRKGEGRTVFNLFVVWALTGMWHGASWNFIFWGLYYFVFLVLEKRVFARRFKDAPGAVWHLYTLVVVFFGWILFKFTDLSLLGTMFKGMFGLNHNGFTNIEVTMALKNNLFFIAASIFGCTPVLRNVYNAMCRKCKRNLIFKYVRRAIEVAGPTVLLLLATMALVGNSYNPFLYAKF